MSIKELLEQIIFEQGIRLRKEYMSDCSGEYFVNKKSVVFITVLPEYDDPKEETFTLGHEVGHHMTGVESDFMKPDLSPAEKTARDRAEHRANRWATEWFMPLEKLIQAYEDGVNTPLDLADYVGLPLEELCHGIEMYYSIHGSRTIHGQYVINWNPFFIKKDRRRKP